MKEENIDILCVGEVLIDFIGHQAGVNIDQTRDYHRYLGGSPTNVAMNCARLGLNSHLVATLGADGFGRYMLEKFGVVKVNTQAVKTHKKFPTSVIFVSQTTGTPDFIPYRSADVFIEEDQIPASLLDRVRVYHTTCFALSKAPAQHTILAKAKVAAEKGCVLSIDVNYADEIWDSKEEALRVLKEYCQYNPLVKVSEDDMQRLFGKTLSHQEIAEFFHEIGVDTVCLTLGSNGVKLAQKGKETIALPAIKVEKIVDATGAGDAFLSGFLFAYIKEKPMEQCLEIALKLAALKLQNIGRLPNNINVLSALL